MIVYTTMRKYRNHFDTCNRQNMYCNDKIVTSRSIINPIFDFYMSSIKQKTTIVLLLLIGIATGMSSCCKKKVYCKDAVLDFSFTGFLRQEVRSFTLRRYAKDSNFEKVLDSAQFIYAAAAPVTSRPDTLPLSDYMTVNSINGISRENDWVIYLPATKKEFYISDIGDNGNRSILVRCGDKEKSCVADIIHLSINGRWKEGGFLYIEEGKY